MHRFLTPALLLVGPALLAFAGCRSTRATDPVPSSFLGDLSHLMPIDARVDGTKDAARRWGHAEDAFDVWTTQIRARLDELR